MEALDGYLVICSYVIAGMDFVSALIFASVSGILYIQFSHWTSLAALIFSLLWIVIILMLLSGIYKRYPTYVRYWLVFTCLGIMLDALLLLYGLSLAVSINWEGVKLTLMPFAGLAVEMTFVYIIYLFYIDMLDSDSWIPVSKSCNCRPRGGCSEVEPKGNASNSDSKEKERKRLRKMYKREKKAVQKELERKLLRGQV